MLGKVKVLSSKFVATAREPREVIPSGSTSDGNFRVDRIVVAPIDVKLEGVSNVSETILDSQKAYADAGLHPEWTTAVEFTDAKIRDTQ